MNNFWWFINLTRRQPFKILANIKLVRRYYSIPLIPVAGDGTLHDHLIIYMHEGQLPIWCNMERLLKTIPPNGKLYLVQGDLANPYYHFPVYAQHIKNQ